jgi:hypothetical protein
MTIPASALAFTYRMPVGFPGTISRTYATKIEPGVIDTAAPPAFFGQALAFDSGALALRPPVAGDTSVVGFAVRSFPTQGNFPATPLVDPIGTANVPVMGEIDVMVSGYMVVTLSGTAPANRYQPVYVWVGATAGSHVNGGVEAAYAALFATAAKTGGNTGNGTFTVAPTIGATNPAQFYGGVYAVVFTGATTFNVYDPNGVELQPGVTGTPYVDNKIQFTITAGGTAFVAGDGFNITATPQTITLPKSYFMGPADSNGITEISFNV